ncbi:MAG: RNA polymerase sigma factor [Planctomycetota bacterium]|jgi:RNA polymerase sigma-70 factor (ECF subfamily)
MKSPGTDPPLPGLAAGDERAFAALYDRFAVRLYRVALAMLGRAEDAEDAVQDVFTAMVRSRKGLTEVRDLEAYVFTALRRAAARLAVWRARQPTASDTAAGEAVSREDRPGSSNPHGQRLEQALRALPPEQREVIALKIDGELTFGQIAQVKGVSINTAASRYRYALEKLRRALQAAGPTSAPEE